MRPLLLAYSCLLSPWPGHRGSCCFHPTLWAYLKLQLWHSVGACWGRRPAHKQLQLAAAERQLEIPARGSCSKEEELDSSDEELEHATSRTLFFPLIWLLAATVPSLEDPGLTAVLFSRCCRHATVPSWDADGPLPVTTVHELGPARVSFGCGECNCVS